MTKLFFPGKSILLSCCLSMLLALSCKKDKQPFTDPATLPVVTTMQYYMYDGQIYTSGPHYYNQFILNDLGLPNSVILINGHHFSQDFKESSVLFNHISAAAISGDSTKIIVMIPDNVSPGPVTLTINTNGKSIVHPTKFSVEAPNPRISGLSAEGGMAGGKIIIYGSDFSTTPADNIVTVNGVRATVDAASLSGIAVTVPQNSGAGKVVLTTHGVTLTYNNDFTTNGSTFAVLTAGAPSVRLQNLALDAAGSIYGTVNNTVYKITPGGQPAVFAQIPAGADEVPYIAGCAVDAAGNIYIASPYVGVPSRSSSVINGPAKIYKITPAGDMSVFAGADYTGQKDGHGVQALFRGPKNIVIDASGNLYVNDQTSVRKITPGGAVSTLASIGLVMAMAIDANKGMLYVAEPVGGNNMPFSAQIRKITTDGVISTPVINPLPGAVAGGLFPDIKPDYDLAMHMAADLSGNLVITLGARVYKIKNSVITDTYLNPTYGNIIGFAVDPAGKLYLSLPASGNNQSSADNFVIYKVTP